jgi:hypothetical protein
MYQSVDSGASYQVVTTFTARATMGRTINALGNYQSGNTVDELNSITVSLQFGTLVSVSYANLLEGAQAALIGDEIVYFRDAALNASGLYTLRGFLRGRRGTEAAMATHGIGDRFVLLTTSAVKRIAQETSDIGKTRLYKMVTSGAPLSSAAPRSFTNDGAALKPYAPVYVGGGRAADGSLLLSWVRRTRISGEWRNSVDVPLGEATEAYRVEILNGSAVVRTIDTTTPNATYLAADQVADFGSPQASVSLRVYQMSQVLGPGYPASATI